LTFYRWAAIERRFVALYLGGLSDAQGGHRAGNACDALARDALAEPTAQRILPTLELTFSFPRCEREFAQ
jgi:hypothetical protein